MRAINADPRLTRGLVQAWIPDVSGALRPMVVLDPASMREAERQIAGALLYAARHGIVDEDCG